MNTNIIVKIILDLIDAGVLIPLVVFGVKFLIAHTKDERLKSAERWALQALASAKQEHSNDEDARKQAISNLITILDKNKYRDKFDDQRVIELIDNAIQQITIDNK